MPTEPNPSGIAKSVLTAAAILTGGILVAFVVTFGLRMGLGDSPSAVAILFLFTLAPIWTTTLALTASVSEEGTRVIRVSLAFTFGMLLPVGGLLFGRLNAVVGLVVVGLLLRWSLRAVFNSCQVSRLAIQSLVIGFLLALTGSGSYLFLPELLRLGLAHSDAYFHITIAQMIAGHGVPSIGADGLIPVRYHYGSHVVAAGLSKTSGASVDLTYLYWRAISLKAQLAWAIVLCATYVCKQLRALPGPFGSLLCGILSILITSFWVSESQLAALVVFLGLVPLLGWLLEQKDAASRSFQVGFCVALATTFLLAVTKVSVGYFCALALLLVCWKHRRVRSIAFGGLVSLGALALLTARYWAPEDTMLWRAGLGVLMSSYVQYFTIKTLVSYALPTALVLIAARQVHRPEPGIPDIRDGFGNPPRATARLREAIHRMGTARGVYQLLAVSLAGCLFALITLPIGSNLEYFSNVPLQLSIVLLPATWTSLIDTLPFRRVGLALLLILCALETRPFVAEVANTVVGLHHSVLPDKAEVLAAMRNSIMEYGTPWSSFRSKLDQTSWEQFIRDMKNKQPDVGLLVVHVRPTATEVWQRMRGGSAYWCMTGHLPIPAETGLVQIRSIAPYGSERLCMPPGIIWYGFGDRQDLHRTGNFTAQQLCAAAKPVNATRIYIVSSISNLTENELIDCRSP
jgi:hypothetical protein